MNPLPIDPLLPEAADLLTHSNNLVLQAPPGSGKTTRIPPSLLTLNLGEVWVLEPRRLAARLAARRVASERREKVGDTVGYQVRFEEAAGPGTRIRYLTEGVFTRKLLSNPALKGVGVVILDEFHERHLEGDLALALSLRLQQAERPDLRIVVMSATMDAEPIARHLGSCRVLRSDGKLFDLQIDYSPVSGDALEHQVAEALKKLLREGLEGDVLVFLPGAAEIRRAARACENIARRANLLIAPLHGDLSPEEQDRAISPAGQHKIILSTNVAESSITVEGVTAVIDSGLARIPGYSKATGLPTLAVSRISKASATQRAGRAARLRPGRALRLYPEQDFHRRHEHEVPEIARIELSSLCLQLHAMGIRDPNNLPWLEPPPGDTTAAAEELLSRLDALGRDRKLTATGGRMAAYPVHPRLARLVVEAERRGALDDGCAIASLLSTGERLAADTHAAGPSDLLWLLEAAWSGSTKRTFTQIRRMARMAGAGSRRQRARMTRSNRTRVAQAGGNARVFGKCSPQEHDEALLISILTAYPDRVARRRATASERLPQGGKPVKDKSAAEVLLASGGAASLARNSVVRGSEFLVAVDLEQRGEKAFPEVRLASEIQAEWLLDLYPDRIREHQAMEWNRAEERVEAVSALLYDDLVIEESRRADADPEAAAKLLAQQAWTAGIDRFVDREELDAYLGRAAFAAQHAALPQLAEEDVRAALESLCQGLRSFDELRAAAGKGGFLQILESRLPPDAPGKIEKLAPARIELPNGRRTKVHYESGKPPWIASRLQDFFGMRETPRVGGGEVPVVVHLLAPNHRPVQMTTDLAGFWERLYPEIRRQLMRRYPKHAWPEKPAGPRAKK